MEAVGLSESLRAVLNDPQDLEDALRLGFPQGKNLHDTEDRQQVRGSRSARAGATVPHPCSTQKEPDAPNSQIQLLKRNPEVFTAPWRQSFNS